MIVSKLGIVPTSIEFMDRLAVETSCKYLNEHLDYESCGSMLLIEVDGTTQDQVDGEAEMIGDLCMERKAIEVYVADNTTHAGTGLGGAAQHRRSLQGSICPTKPGRHRRADCADSGAD